MRRSELVPLPALQHAIPILWAVEAPAVDAARPDVLPDPYRELIVNCGAPLALELAPGHQIALPQVFLNDLHLRPLRFRTAGPFCVLGVRFYPWAVLTCLDLQPPLVAPSIRPLGGPWDRLAAELARLVHAQGIPVALQALHHILQTQYRVRQHDVRMVAVIQTLLGAPHVHPRIHDLARASALSLRQFQRRFHQATGVPPKLLARLVRFEAVCAAITAQPRPPMAVVAAAFGYADQAHLIHDVQALAATTPSGVGPHDAADGAWTNDVVFFQDTACGTQ
jgi:AraC-like DNA-binding protein